MKRYIINDELKETLYNINNYNQRQLSKILGFNLKNILYVNQTINEEHLAKLTSFLNRQFFLQEVNLNYESNLGKYAVSPNIIKLEISEDLAEFIGIMLGDGNLHKYGLNIAFDKRNNNYMKYVSDLFYRILGSEMKRKIIKTTNQGYLYFYSKKLAENLTEFGLVKGDKIRNQIGIPQWIKEKEEYVKRCIRGLIDTDGCIYTCKRDKKRYIKFTNFNQRLLEEFRNLALNQGYHFASANRRNVCLYRKDEVLKFINDIKPIRAGAVV